MGDWHSVRREFHLDDMGSDRVTRDQELWGVALWVEKTHGGCGPDHIAAQVSRLAAEGDEEGIAMWRAVAERFDKLHERTMPH
jgi:hypothetical protein